MLWDVYRAAIKIVELLYRNLQNPLRMPSAHVTSVVLTASTVILAAVLSPQFDLDADSAAQDRPDFMSMAKDIFEENKWQIQIPRGVEDPYSILSKFSRIVESAKKRRADGKSGINVVE